jgi:mannose-6-phosphate isomerase-like protein (cupin superfamily)
MEIMQIAVGTGTIRRPPVPNAPFAEVLLGAQDDSPVGVVQVTVPAGGGMPEHDHGPSTVVLIPRAGEAELIDVADGDRALRLLPDTITTIPVGRRVRLHNPGSVDAQLLVVVSPPDFARRIDAWPSADDGID